MSREHISHVRIRQEGDVWPVPEGKAAEQKKPSKKYVKIFNEQEANEVRTALQALRLKEYIHGLYTAMDAEQAEKRYGGDLRMAEAILQGLRNPRDEEERQTYASMLESLQLNYPIPSKTER